MSAHCINYLDLDITKMVYQPVTTNKGFKSHPILYDADGVSRPLNITSPERILHWGASDYNGNKQFSVAVPFFSVGADPRFEAFKLILEQLDENAKEFAFNNSRDLFGSVKSRETIDAYYSPILKPFTSRATGAQMQKVVFKIKTRGEMFDFQLYDGVSRQLLFPTEAEHTNPSNVIPKESTTLQIIFCVESLWVKGKQFGVRLVMKQGHVFY